jgi:hypothetical protein
MTLEGLDPAILGPAMAAGLPTLVTRSFYTANENFDGALAVLPDLSAARLSDIRLMHLIKKS